MTITRAEFSIVNGRALVKAIRKVINSKADYEELSIAGSIITVARNDYDPGMFSLTIDTGEQVDQPEPG